MVGVNSPGALEAAQMSHMTACRRTKKQSSVQQTSSLASCSHGTPRGSLPGCSLSSAITQEFYRDVMMMKPASQNVNLQLLLQ